MKKKEAAKYAKGEVLFGAFSFEQNELRRQKRMLYWFTGLLVPYDFAYANIWLHSPYQWYGWILVGSGVLSFFSFAFYFLHHNIAVAKAGVTISALVNLPTLLLFPAIGRTGIYWMQLFPPLTYLYQGLFLGNIYNAIFFVTIVVFQVLQGKGILPVVYNQVEMGQMWSELIVMILLGHAAESGWTKSRRLLAEQRERLRALLANLPVGVIMAEKDGKPSAANSSAEALFGQPITEAVNVKDFPEKFRIMKENGTPYSPDDMSLNMAVKTGSPVRKTDEFVQRPDGSRIALRVAASPVRNSAGKVIAAVAAYEDMTKEHEIDQMKSEFVSLASHQLKTPLTAMKWSTETLLSGDNGELSKTQKDAVGTMKEVVERLLRLVGDLLSVSRIETGKKFNIVKEKTDIVPIFNAITGEMAHAATEKKVKFSSTLPSAVTLDVDPDKIREVFANLLSNAVKYSKSGGKIEIGLAPKSPAGMATVVVKDDGLGIPKDQQAKVFERFFRAANVPEDSEGTGLGLYIVKAIVEKHGGRIWFESEEGKGTTFFVELPVAK